MNFPLFISTYYTSSSRVHNVIIEINILNIEICLTNANKKNLVQNKFYLLFSKTNNDLYNKPTDMPV